METVKSGVEFRLTALSEKGCPVGTVGIEFVLSFPLHERIFYFQTFA